MKRPQKVSNIAKKDVFCKRPQKRRVVETVETPGRAIMSHSSIAMASPRSPAWRWSRPSCRSVFWLQRRSWRVKAKRWTSCGSWAKDRGLGGRIGHDRTGMTRMTGMTRITAGYAMLAMWWHTQSYTRHELYEWLWVWVLSGIQVHQHFAMFRSLAS